MILFPNAKNIFSKKLEKYINNLQKLFDSMSKSTNSNVIIDSSKSTVYSYILSLLDNVDLPHSHAILTINIWSAYGNNKYAWFLAGPKHLWQTKNWKK